MATNSIRGGKNRVVLEAITRTARIYEAWSDEAWVNDGAAVRVSLIAFGHATQAARLDGMQTAAIHADLTPASANGSRVDLTTAKRLAENAGACFEGVKKYGPFDIPGETARAWLQLAGNPNRRPNSDVLRPWINATDVVRKDSDTWVIDFNGLSEGEAALYEKPFEFAHKHVLPARAKDRNTRTRTQWWRFERQRIEMRNSIAALPRFIVSPVVAKHRIFAWRSSPTLSMNLLDVTARADDTTFGILHGRFHELWSLRMCTWLGVGNDPRYNKTRCFDTFPFPAESNEQQAKIRALAEQLDTHRKHQQAIYRDLTLTGMYNVLDKLRSGEPLNAKERTLHEHGLVSVLRQLHDELDAAVLAAYGWSDLLALLRIAHGNESPAAEQSRDEVKRGFDEAILERLVALNAERVAEEARGLVRWLRPEFQNPNTRSAPVQASFDATSDVTESQSVFPPRSLPWPKDTVEQVRAVADLLSTSIIPLSLDDIAARFAGRGPWKRRLPQLLEMLVALGRAHELTGRYSGGR